MSAEEIEDAQRRSEQIIRTGAEADIDGDISRPEAMQPPVADAPMPPSASEGEQIDVETALPAPPPSSPAFGLPLASSTEFSAITGAPMLGGKLPMSGYTPDPAYLVAESAPHISPQSDLASPAVGTGEVVGDPVNRRRSTRKEAGARDDKFKRRMIQHSQKDLLFELRVDGTYDMKEMTVREAFNYVQKIVMPYSLETCMSPAKSTTTTAATSTATNSNDNKDGNNLPNPTAAKGHLKTHRIQSAGSSGSIRARPALSSAGMQMSSLNLHQRDMRQLFSSQSKTEPAFSVRRNCILINFETLRGIVLVDRLLLVVDTGADSILMDVSKAISESTEDVYEFELKAVEALLSVSSKRLEREIREVEGPVAKIVHILEGHHSRANSAENNDKFRVLSNKINVLENRAKARKRALLMVLEDDTDLAMMNLTRMYQSPEDYVPPLSAEVLEDHEEMELLLEAYLQDINSASNVLDLLQARVRSTEALVMVKLDIARNRILTAGLIFSMGSTCFTLGTLISGLFGMNLHSGLEAKSTVFTAVAVGTVTACTLAFCGVFTFFYRHGILVS